MLTQILPIYLPCCYANDHRPQGSSCLKLFNGDITDMYLRTDLSLSFISLINFKHIGNIHSDFANKVTSELVRHCCYASAHRPL